MLKCIAIDDEPLHWLYLPCLSDELRADGICRRVCPPAHAADLENTGAQTDFLPDQVVVLAGKVGYEILDAEALMNALAP